MKCPILSFVTFLSISLIHAADNGDKANPKSEFTLVFPDIGDKGELSKLQVHYVLLKHPESRDAGWIYDHCEYTGPDRELSISTSLAKWGDKGTAKGLERLYFARAISRKQSTWDRWRPRKKWFSNLSDFRRFLSMGKSFLTIVLTRTI